MKSNYVLNEKTNGSTIFINLYPPLRALMITVFDMTGQLGLNRYLFIAGHKMLIENKYAWLSSYGLRVDGRYK